MCNSHTAYQQKAEGPLTDAELQFIERAAQAARVFQERHPGTSFEGYLYGVPIVTQEMSARLVAEVNRLRRIVSEVRLAVKE